MQQIQTAGLLYVLKAQLLVVPGANLPATRQRTFIKTQRAAVFVEQKGEKKPDLIFKAKPTKKDPRRTIQLGVSWSSRRMCVFTHTQFSADVALED